MGSSKSVNPDEAQLSVGGCPEISVSGHPNLRKPASEDQVLAATQITGFLGKAIRSL
jgi:hypothetical protein